MVYAVGDIYRFGAIDITGLENTEDNASEITFTLDDALQGFLIDTKDGYIQGTPTTPGNYSMLLYAVDSRKERALVETLELEVKRKDTDVPEYGPNGAGCAHGEAKDEVLFDNSFACDCSGTSYTGINCQTFNNETASTTDSSDDSSSSNAIGGLLGGFVAVLAVAFVVYKYRVHALAMRVFDFEVQMADMVAKGELELEQVAGGRYPREIKRSNVTTTQVVGAGAFGEVWKAVLDETGQGGVPGYLCAVKTSKDATGEGADELRGEALVMAQVVGHQNVVALIGVVTSGVPLMLLLSLCEHGSLQSCLKEKKFASQSKDSGYHAPSTLETLKMAIEIASGMDHLVQASFVHRDLAARNVLLDSQFICKIADFGLSRGIGAAMVPRIPITTLQKSTTHRTGANSRYGGRHPKQLKR